MAQSSNGLEVPEMTNGGSIPGCDDEIGGGVLEQVGEMEIKGRVFPLKEVLEMIERKCQDYDQGAAGSGEGETSYVRRDFSGKGWESKELRMLINRGLNGDFTTFSRVSYLAFLIKFILDGGAARGSEGGFAHLTQCEVDKVKLRTNALLDLIGDSRNFARRQSNPLISFLNKWCEADEFEQAICKGGVPHMAGKQIKSTRGGEGDTAHLAGLQIKPLVSSSHDPLISSLSKGCEGDEFERWINVMLNGAAARGGKLDQPEVDKLARQINKILDTLSEGGTAHLAGTSRPGNRATEQSHREPKNRATGSHNFGSIKSFASYRPRPLSYENLLLNWGAAKGNEVGNDSMPLNNMSTSSGKYPPGFAPAGTSRPQNRATESHISGGGRLEQGEDGGNKVREELLHSISFNIPEHLVNCHYRLAFPYNGLLCQDAAGGNKDWCRDYFGPEGQGEMFQPVGPLNVSGTANLTQWEVDQLAGQINVSTCSLSPFASLHIENTSLLTCYITLHLQQLPDSVPLNNVWTSTGNYPPGFAPAGKSRARSNMFLESHNIDSKDEKPKSTDFMFRKPNNMFLECVVALFLSLCVTVMLPPKCFLRIILGLLAISLTCHFTVIVFSKKLPAKIANLALSLAITCNGCSFLLMAGFFLAKI